MENNENQNQENKKGLSALQFAIILIVVLIIGICVGSVFTRTAEVSSKNGAQKSSNNYELQNQTSFENDKNLETKATLIEGTVDIDESDNKTTDSTNKSENKTVNKTESKTANKVEDKKENQSSTALEKYEKDDFYFYAPKKWNIKIQKNNTTNSEEEYYEIIGEVNGKEQKAFSIKMSYELDDLASWETLSECNKGYINVRQDFYCNQNSGSKNTSEDKKFEEDIEKSIESITIKYTIKNEWGSADKTTILEGKYFTRGEAGTNIRSNIYYIKDGNLYLTKLQDEFPTEKLASSVKKLEKHDTKVYAYTDNESLLNTEVDSYIVYKKAY